MESGIVQSFREHDVYREVTEEERWTVPSENIIPGKSVFTIKREGTKQVRIVGCGNVQEDTGFAVFTAKRECDICQGCHVDCRYVGMVLDRKRCMCLEARENILKQSCAGLVLWIIAWLFAETGQLFLALGHVSDVLKSWGMSDV